MKKFFLGLCVGLLASLPIFTFAATNLASKLSGKILLQVESKGEAWYVNPSDGKRYYMANGNEAYSIMRNLGLGISNNDLNKIQTGSIIPREISAKELFNGVGNFTSKELKNNGKIKISYTIEPEWFSLYTISILDKDGKNICRQSNSTTNKETSFFTCEITSNYFLKIETDSKAKWNISIEKS